MLDVETFAATASSLNVRIIKHETTAQLLLNKVHFCAYDVHQSLSVNEYLYTYKITNTQIINKQFFI